MPDEINEIEELINNLLVNLNTVHDLFFAITFTEDWKQWDNEMQLLFRNAVKVLNGVASVHREKFDSDVWKGHANGTVETNITSIRNERTGDKPGKKAEAPTAASILAKRLSK